MFSGSELKASLIAKFDKYNIGVRVAFLDGKDDHYASLAEIDLQDKVEVGCIMKGFVAILSSIAIQEKLLDLNTKAIVFFSDELTDENYAHHFSKTCLGHLLSHSCGVDDLVVDNTLYDECGFIDTKKIISTMQTAELIAPPGRIFSNSNLGFIFAASILEKLYNKKFKDILIEKLLHPLNIDLEDHREAEYICPATGANFVISISSLLSVIKLYLFDNPSLPSLKSILLDMLKSSFWYGVPIDPYENTQAGPGWYRFGDRCYGYSGYSRSAATVIKFIPDSKIIIIAIARKKFIAYSVIQTLFKDIFSEIDTPRMIKVMNVEPGCKINLTQYEGVYQNYKYIVKIQRFHGEDDASLEAFVSYKNIHRSGDGTIVQRYKLANNHLFVAKGSEAKIFSSLQFDYLIGDTKFKYVHMANLLFSRLE